MLETTSKFGSALRVWRKENRISAALLAAQLRVSAPLISSLETGTKPPSQEILGKLREKGFVSPDLEETHAPEAVSNSGLESRKASRVPTYASQENAMEQCKRRIFQSFIDCYLEIWQPAPKDLLKGVEKLIKTWDLLHINRRIHLKQCVECDLRTDDKLIENPSYFKFNNRPIGKRLDPELRRLFERIEKITDLEAVPIPCVY